jgi:hypothetical protein
MKCKDEITMLKRECNLTHKAVIVEQRMAPNPTSIYEELAKLREQVRPNSSSTTNIFIAHQQKVLQILCIPHVT